jgi:hypothetical protein
MGLLLKGTLYKIKERREGRTANSQSPPRERRNG